MMPDARKGKAPHGEQVARRTLHEHLADAPVHPARDLAGRTCGTAIGSEAFYLGRRARKRPPKRTPAAFFVGCDACSAADGSGHFCSEMALFLLDALAQLEADIVHLERSEIHVPVWFFSDFLAQGARGLVGLAFKSVGRIAIPEPGKDNCANEQDWANDYR